MPRHAIYAVHSSAVEGGPVYGVPQRRMSSAVVAGQHANGLGGIPARLPCVREIATGKNPKLKLRFTCSRKSAP